MRLGISIVVFLVLQVFAALLFKWGSGGEGRWWLGFLGGNALGITSIVFLMKMYHDLHPNLAAAIGTGGSFLLIQLAMAFCFTSGLSIGQWSGAFLICAGIALLALT